MLYLGTENTFGLSVLCSAGGGGELGEGDGECLGKIGAVLSFPRILKTHF